MLIIGGSVSRPDNLEASPQVECSTKAPRGGKVDSKEELELLPFLDLQHPQFRLVVQNRATARGKA